MQVTTIMLGSAEVSPDRSRLRLPARLFGRPDLKAPVAWPALAKEAFGRYGEPNNAMSRRQVPRHFVVLDVQRPQATPAQRRR